MNLRVVCATCGKRVFTLPCGCGSGMGHIVVNRDALEKIEWGMRGE